ncbi:MAG: hypothetical protein Q4G59_11290, partial [Planctomycetia bacterium]|nr:hypothetical protein [Planctomycetia bacterium]
MNQTMNPLGWLPIIVVTLIAIGIIAFFVWQHYAANSGPQPDVSTKTTNTPENEKPTVKQNEEPATEQMKEMFSALQTHDVVRAKALLEVGFDPNAVVPEGLPCPAGTTFFPAAMASSPEIAFCFLDHGADVHQKYNGLTMLHMACMGNQWPVAKRLSEEYKLDP